MYLNYLVPTIKWIYYSHLLIESLEYMIYLLLYSIFTLELDTELESKVVSSLLTLNKLLWLKAIIITYRLAWFYFQKYVLYFKDNSQKRY